MISLTASQQTALENSQVSVETIWKLFPNTTNRHNRLYDSSFDISIPGETDKWTLTGATRDLTEHKFGTTSLKIDAANESAKQYLLVHPDFPEKVYRVELGKNYVLSFYHKGTVTAGNITVAIKTDTNTIDSEILTSPINNATWTRYTHAFTLSHASLTVNLDTTLRLEFLASAGFTGISYIDNVSLHEDFIYDDTTWDNTAALWTPLEPTVHHDDDGITLDVTDYNIHQETSIAPDGSITLPSGTLKFANPDRLFSPFVFNDVFDPANYKYIGKKQGDGLGAFKDGNRVVGYEKYTDPADGTTFYIDIGVFNIQNIIPDVETGEITLELNNYWSDLSTKSGGYIMQSNVDAATIIRKLIYLAGYNDSGDNLYSVGFFYNNPFFFCEENDKFLDILSRLASANKKQVYVSADSVLTIQDIIGSPTLTSKTISYDSVATMTPIARKRASGIIMRSDPYILSETNGYEIDHTTQAGNIDQSTMGTDGAYFYTLGSSALLNTDDVDLNGNGDYANLFNNTTNAASHNYYFLGAGTASLTSDENASPYFEVDLGTGAKVISTINLWLYSAAGDGHNHYFKVKASLDQDKWYYLAGSKTKFVESNPNFFEDHRAVINNFAPVYARYIRVYMNGGTTLGGNFTYNRIWDISFYRNSFQSSMLLSDGSGFGTVSIESGGIRVWKNEAHCDANLTFQLVSRTGHTRIRGIGISSEPDPILHVAGTCDAGFKIWDGYVAATNCAGSRTFELNTSNGNLTIVGTVCAAAGCIGGYTIGATNLTAGTNPNFVGMSSSAACPAFWTGCCVGGSAPFQVCHDGCLVATNATICGTICACVGSIGGWCVQTGCLCSGNAIIYSGAANVARFQVCQNATAYTAGINSGAAAADIAFWSGCCFECRTAAPFRVCMNGALVATSATITGTICANAGYFCSCIYAGAGCIAGWSLTTCKICAGNVGMDSCATAGTVAFYAGCTTPACAPFRVTNAGVLVASSATITGTVCASLGVIGGFTIGATTLTSGTGVTAVGISSSNACPAFWTGATLGCDSLFRVLHDGCVVATAGTIAGFTIGSVDGMYFGLDATRVQMKPGAGFWAGATVQTSAPFYVTSAGALCSISGSIGGWTIGAGCLYSISSESCIYLYPANCTIFIANCCAYAFMGKMFWCCAYRDAWGYNIVDKAGNCADFMVGKMGAGALSIPSGTSVAARCAFFYIGSGSTSYAEYYNGIFTVKGTICAGLGCIGGFTICSDAICSTPAAGCAVGISSCATSGAISFWSGCSTVASAPFRVSNLGALVATSATITGTICANAGYFCSCIYAGAGCIAGWSLTTCKICAGNVGMDSCATAGTVAFYAGCTTPASAPFRVTNQGCLVATSATITGTITACTGLIGGWCIGTDCLCSTNVGLSSNTGACCVTIWAGCSTPTSAPFRVRNTGEIYSVCGTVGGWTLGTSSLSANNITICSSGLVQTSNYASGLRGWKISCSGDAEFANAVIRGELRSAVFVYDEIHAVGGQLFVGGSSILLGCATTPAALGCCFSFCVKDPPSGHACIFSVGHVLEVKTFNGTNVYDVWGQVASVCDRTSYYEYCTVLCKGSLGIVIPTGTTVITYGAPTNCCGAIKINGQGVCSPYMDVFITGTTPWDCLTPKVRLGTLNGISMFSGCACCEYGLWTCSGYIVGGVVMSNNWDASNGSCFDLTNGCLVIGGSSAPKLKFDNTNLCLRGFVNITGGINALVNNHALSGNICGWSYACQGMVSVTFGGATVCAHEITTAADVMSLSDYAEIDPTQIYKLNLAMCTLGDCTCGTNYWGLYAYDAACTTLSVTPVCTDKTTCGVATNNFYMWFGDTVGWCCFETFLYPTGITSNNVPTSSGATYNGAILPTNTKYIRLRYLNYYHCLASPTTVYFYCPNLEVYTGNSKLGIASNKVAPSNPVSPSGAGLYLGCDYLGYYDNTRWRALINSSGHMCLADAAGALGLSWNGSALSIVGAVCATSGYFCSCIYACTGSIGGFTLATNCLYSHPAVGCGVGMQSLTGSGCVAFYAGCSTPASAPFRVTNLGALVATSATITGAICSTGLFYHDYDGAHSQRFITTDALCNNFIGDLAGNTTLSGAANTGIGNLALCSITTGLGNTGVGNCAGRLLTTGCYNDFVGAYSGACCEITGVGNTGIGNLSLYRLTTGCFNVGVGRSSLSSITTGSCNTGVGYYTLANATSGKYNTAIGMFALGCCDITADGNIGIGYLAGYRINSGAYNVAIGHFAAPFLTTGVNNTTVGLCSGYNLSTGCHNTLVGASIALATLTGNLNTIVGACNALAITSGSENTVIGNSSYSASTTGYRNVTVGSLVSTALSSGNNNVFIGYAANNSGITTGALNVGIGTLSLDELTTGYYNTAVGGYSMCSTTTGCANTAIGYAAMYLGALTGLFNTSVGYGSAMNISSGSYNTSVGSYAVGNLTTGSCNVIVGSCAAIHAVAANHNTIIGTDAVKTGILTGDANVILGACSAVALTSGTNNTIVGTCASIALTTGGCNTFVGFYSNLTGITTGVANTGIGYLSAAMLTSGASNTLIGSCSGYSITTGSNNVAIGKDSLYGNALTGSYNTAIGDSSGYWLTTGSCNVIIGSCAANHISTALHNTIIGTDAVKTGVLTGSCNTVVGACSALAMTSATGNVIVGSYSGSAITSGSLNVVVGNCSLSSLNTGQRNTAVGYYSMTLACCDAVSGCMACYNTAIGMYSMYGLTTGCYNVAMGYNTMGTGATTGSFNVAIGYNSLQDVVDGSNNTGVGVWSLGNLTSGCGNTAVGYGALYSGVTTGNNNTVLGYYSGIAITSGACNVIIGSCAAFYTTTGSSNTIIGSDAAKTCIITGSNNVVVGACSALFLTSGYNNVVIGVDSLTSTTGGYQNVIVGNSSAKNLTTGACNVGIGPFAFGTGVVTGVENVAIGICSAGAITSGTYNTSIGSYSSQSLTTGTARVAVGYGAMFTSLTGNNSVAVGFYALGFCDVTGTGNVAIGYNSGYRVSSGAYNTLVGYASSLGLTTGSCNTIIGSCAAYNSTTGTSNTVIGTDAVKTGVVTGSNNVVVGACSALVLTTGAYNTTIGACSLRAHTAGDGNTSVGYGSMACACCCSTGPLYPIANTAIGMYSQQKLLTGCYNVSTGYLSIGCGLATGSNNVASGVFTLYNLTSGIGNVATGNYSMCGLTTGCYNIAIGYASLYTCTATGNHNVAIGYTALNTLTSGSCNVMSGMCSGGKLTTGSANTGFGAYSMGLGIVTGGCNTAVGYCSLYDLTSGYYNTAVGVSSSENLTTGYANTAIGSCSLFSATNSEGNTVVGYGAMYSATINGATLCSPHYNTVIGTSAFFFACTGCYNTAVGTQALGWGYVTGSNNVGVGTASLYDLTSGNSNVAVGDFSLANLTTGCYNTAVGANALYNITTGSNLVAVGYDALKANTSGTDNVAIGQGAMVANTIGSCNVATGFGSMLANIDGQFNVSIGAYSMLTGTSACENVSVGPFAMSSITTGKCNVAIGRLALASITTGCTNIGIGYQGGQSWGTSDCNNIAIGAGGSGGDQNKIYLGNNTHACTMLYGDVCMNCVTYARWLCASLGIVTAGAFYSGSAAGGGIAIGESGWCDTGTYFCKSGTRPFYITSATGISYIYSAAIYLGSTTGTTVYTRGNTITGNCFCINAATGQSCFRFNGSYGICGIASSCIGVYGCAGDRVGVFGFAVVACPVGGNGDYYNACSSEHIKLARENICVLPVINNFKVQKWMYHDRSQRGFDSFIGPYANEFNNTFDLHFGDGIFAASVAGVALKASQELNECISCQNMCIAKLECIILQMEKRLDLVEKRR